MPPRSSSGRSQVPRAARSAAARPAAERTMPEARASSYTLDQALVPPAQSRDKNDLLYQQRPPDPPSTMASDTRYAYYQSQEVPAPHGYPQYAPYEAQQYAPAQTRPIRNGVAQPTHPPPQQPPSYPPPPDGYLHPSYIPASYDSPPQLPPQWAAADHWQQYPYAPPMPPIQDPQQHNHNGRAEMQAQSTSQPRAPPDNASKQGSPQQNKEQSSPPMEPIPPPKMRLARETEPPPPAPMPLPLPLDFMKVCGLSIKGAGHALIAVHISFTSSLRIHTV